MHKSSICNEEECGSMTFSGVSQHGELRSRGPLSRFAAHCRAEALATMGLRCRKTATEPQLHPIGCQQVKQRLYMCSCAPAWGRQHAHPSGARVCTPERAGSAWQYDDNDTGHLSHLAESRTCASADMHQPSCTRSWLPRPDDGQHFASDMSDANQTPSPT